MKTRRLLPCVLLLLLGTWAFGGPLPVAPAVNFTGHQAVGGAEEYAFVVRKPPGASIFYLCYSSGDTPVLIVQTRRDPAGAWEKESMGWCGNAYDVHEMTDATGPRTARTTLRTACKEFRVGVQFFRTSPADGGGAPAEMAWSEVIKP